MIGWFPLAAIEDWLRFAVPLVFIIIYVVNHLLTALRAAPAAPRNDPRRKADAGPRPPRPPQPQAPPTTPEQAKLNTEIEQFLKRAGERQGDRLKRESPVKPAQRPPKQTPKQPPRQPTREASVAVEPLPQRSFDSVASSVEKHLGHRGFEARSEHLADDIALADEHMEDHLRKAFNRKVGTLGEAKPSGSQPATDSVPAATTADRSDVGLALAGMLANPQTLKQMIVLNEILRRPDEHW
jgi:hypothetical protein